MACAAQLMVNLRRAVKFGECIPTDVVLILILLLGVVALEFLAASGAFALVFFILNLFFEVKCK